MPNDPPSCWRIRIALVARGILQMTAMALVDAARAAFDRWQRADGKADLLGLLDEAADALIAGVSELEASSGRADALTSAARCRSRSPGPSATPPD